MAATPTSSSESCTTDDGPLKITNEFDHNTAQLWLKRFMDTTPEPWTYAILWLSSYNDNTDTPMLEFGTGYFKGELHKKKTTPSASSLEVQVYRKKVLRELALLTLGSQAEESNVEDEDVTDIEWFFLVSMTESFVNGNGLPGHVALTNQPVWVTGRDRLMASHCERVRQGQGLGLQTILCIPTAYGVIELGSTELIFHSPYAMQIIKFCIEQFQIN